MAQALKRAGLKAGDTIFSHSNVGYFGYPEEGQTAEAIFQTILGAFQDVLGPEGTLVVPTFTYSFCKGEAFDPDQTPSTCGMFTEMLRLHPGARRSRDPIFSVAALGPKAESLTLNVPPECFGRNSFWDRFLGEDGVICNLNFDAGSTFIHYAERCLNVPYRYDKLFTGILAQGGQSSKGSAIYFCRDLTNPDSEPAFDAFDVAAREQGFVRSETVGRGAIVAIAASNVYELIERQLKKNTWCFTAGGKKGTACTAIRGANAARFGVSMPDNASMAQIIKDLWLLPRDLISDGYDAALDALAQQVPMTIHEYPTGTHCWTWIIPEKWDCHGAYLETLDGKRLFSYADNPLHVISYSLPFQGEVSRRELFDHLHVHPKLPDAIPFKFKYYERDWGLCCSQNLKDSLTDDRYRVGIDASFSYGMLKVGETVIAGESDESIVLCAHLCHPAMANDDLSGVAVGIEVMRELLKRRNLRYTYRFLILPETIGSVAYLSHNEQIIPKLKGGLFLEMLGLCHSHSLQLSFDGNSEVDRCFALALGEHDPHGWTGAFRTIVGNDERQFNAPGVRVPMLSLSRSLPPSEPDAPFRQYHSSEDTPEAISDGSLQDSCRLVLRMIDVLENNTVPVNCFKGEVFCSRFGLHTDWYSDPEGNDRFFDVMFLIDGTRPIAEIAHAAGIPFSVAENAISELHRHGLVEYAGHGG